MKGVAKELIGLACLVCGLPNISAIVVLKSSDLGDGLVIENERRILPVRTLKAIDKSNDLVCGDLLLGSGSSENLSTPGSVEDTGRFSSSVTVKECIFLGITQSLTELCDDIVLKAKGVIIEEFLSNLNSNMKFVRIKDSLIEGGITESELLAFVDPCSRRLGSCNIDLVLAGSGDSCSQTSYDVFFLKNINDSLVVLLGNEVSAIRVNSLLQNIRDLT